MYRSKGGSYPSNNIVLFSPSSFQLLIVYNLHIVVFIVSQNMDHVFLPAGKPVPMTQ